MFVTSIFSSFTGYASCLYIRSCCQTVDFMLSSGVVVVAVDLVAAKVLAKHKQLPSCVPRPFRCSRTHTHTLPRSDATSQKGLGLSCVANYASAGSSILRIRVNSWLIVLTAKGGGWKRKRGRGTRAGTAAGVLRALRRQLF